MEVLQSPGEQMMKEHGITDVITLWEGWADGRFAPYWREVDLMAIPRDLRAGTMVADYLGDMNDYRVRFWGMGLVDAFSLELTGKLLSEAADRGVMVSFRETAIQVITEKKPQILSHAITSVNGLRRLFPVVRLPITDDGETVSKVMTVENISACLNTLLPKE